MTLPSTAKTFVFNHHFNPNNGPNTCDSCVERQFHTIEDIQEPRNRSNSWIDAEVPPGVHALCQVQLLALQVPAGMWARPIAARGQEAHVAVKPECCNEIVLKSAVHPCTPESRKKNDGWLEKVF